MSVNKTSKHTEAYPSLPDSNPVPATDKSNVYKTYPGRYYVLIVTALLCMQQNIAWLTFGPIPQEAQDKYGLTDIELTILPGK